MKLTLNHDGQLMIHDGDELLALFVEGSSPVRWPTLPSGMAAAEFRIDGGYAVGFDAKGNAFPNITWPDGEALGADVALMIAAHASAKEAEERRRGGDSRRVYPLSVGDDTEDVPYLTDVVIL